MGCGRSKLQSVHPSRKSSAKNKEGEAQENSEEKSAAAGENGETAEEAEARRQAAIAKGRLLGSGPLLAMADISTSQLDFFKMLDEKIENGADYDSSGEPSRSTSPRPSQITLASYNAINLPPTRSPSPALAQNGHKHCAIKFAAQQHVPQSSPTRSKTPTPRSPKKERLPTLQASPPPHEPNTSNNNNNNNIKKNNSIKFGNPMKTPYSMKHRPTT